MAKLIIDVLRPALFTRSSRGSHSHGLRPTAYLDGLRGFAAFLVYWLHHQLWSHGMAMRIFENWYGWDERYYFACLPGIRLFFTGGHFGVAVFYVISGYVLSVKSLKLIQDGDRLGEVGATLGSALFRRWLRLYIPVAATTFLYMLFWHVTGIMPENPVAKPNLRGEAWNWYTNFKNYSFVYRDTVLPWCDYNFHSWSLPMEFNGSLIVFTSLQAFVRCSRNARMWCCLVLMFYFFVVVDAWYGTAFLGGMLICDMHLQAENGNLPKPALFRRLNCKPVYYLLLVIAIYLGGAPSNDVLVETVRANPGWYYLSYLAPEAMHDPKWAYLVPAAILLIITIPRLPWLKAFFETRFIQYLGRISYAFYLVHGPVLWLFGDRLYAATGMVRPWHQEHLPNWVNLFPLPSGPLGLELCFLAPHLILLPFTLWVAEVATRMFDEPSVKFTGWLYKRVCR